jgi:type III pantothenate kinase
MIICDIGNTNVKIYEDGRVWTKSVSEFYDFKTNENVYYICVNKGVESYISKYKNFINLEPYIEFDTIYNGLGIDRIAVCRAINDGIVVDAGSAITIDIMSNGIHLGGYILPGLQSYAQSYKSISPLLDKQINPHVTLDALPQNTQDAISYAVIKSIILILNDTAGRKKIYFTGGDGQYFSSFFEQSVYDRMLVFKGLEDIAKQVSETI